MPVVFSTLYARRNADFSFLLEFTGLKPFKDRLAGDLSGGMKQKLALACVLLKKPKLLILDEASVGVDPLSRIELLNLVKSMTDNKTSIIWSSSYLDEAFNFDFCIVLDKGKIIFNGKTKRMGMHEGTKSDWKKAIVKLKEGQEITIEEA